MNLTDITGYDPAYKPIFHAYWADYEESGWIYILLKGSDYYVLEGGYSVMADCLQETTWEDLDSITEEEALKLMVEWEEHEETLFE